MQNMKLRFWEDADCCQQKASTQGMMCQSSTVKGGPCVLGFSILRFRPFFRSVFSVFVPKNFGFLVLVAIAVCGFCYTSLSVFAKNNIGFPALLFDTVSVFFGFLFGKYSPQRPQPRARLLDRNLFRFWHYLYGIAVSYILQCPPRVKSTVSARPSAGWLILKTTKCSLSWFVFLVLWKSTYNREW